MIKEGFLDALGPLDILGEYWQRMAPQLHGRMRGQLAIQRGCLGPGTSPAILETTLPSLSFCDTT